MNVGGGSELHELLRELVERQGAGVIETPEAFRAALDDFLSEDEATLGELNLLGDAVRLGAVDRLVSMLDHGADPMAAVGESGDALARDRGTEDLQRTRWAVAAVGYAIGRVGADVVAAYRRGTSIPGATQTPPAGRPSGPPPPAPPAPVEPEPPVPAAPDTELSPGPGPGTLSERFPDADTWDQQRHPQGYPPPTPPRRARRVWPVVLVVLVLLLAGGGVLAWVLTQDDDPSGNATDDPTDGSSESVTSGTVDINGNTMLLPIKRDGSSLVYAVDPDDPESLHPISEGPADNFPAISPDRETIMFLSRATPDAVWPIVLEVGTGKSRQLFDADDVCDYARRPAFRPDGRRFILTCIDASGEATGTIVTDFDGSDLGTIEVDGVIRGTPTYVSQTQIVFSLTPPDGGPSNLWLMDVQTQELRQLTIDEAGWDSHPDWNPTEEKLLFVRSSSEEPVGELWTMALEGEPELVELDQPVIDPVWSPDGSRIAFRTEDDMLATVPGDDPDNVEVVPGTEDVSGPPVWGDR